MPYTVPERCRAHNEQASRLPPDVLTNVDVPSTLPRNILERCESHCIGSQRFRPVLSSPRGEVTLSKTGTLMIRYDPKVQDLGSMIRKLQESQDATAHFGRSASDIGRMALAEWLPKELGKYGLAAEPEKSSKRPGRGRGRKR